MNSKFVQAENDFKSLNESLGEMSKDHVTLTLPRSIYGKHAYPLKMPKEWKFNQSIQSSDFCEYVGFIDPSDDGKLFFKKIK